MSARIIVLVASLTAAGRVLAATPEFEIAAQYNGFDPLVFAQLQADPKNVSTKQLFAAPHVTAKAGQTVTIEIVREVVLPLGPDGKMPTQADGPIKATTLDRDGNVAVNGRKTVNCGVSLEVTPELKDGKIVISGKTTLRRVLEPGAEQPLNAVSFTSRETYFGDEINDGQTITIRVGDGRKDKARIALTVKRIATATP